MFDLHSAVVIYYKSTHSGMLSLQLDIPLTLVFGDTRFIIIFSRDHS